jgi:Zinc knuckle
MEEALHAALEAEACGYANGEDHERKEKKKTYVRAVVSSTEQKHEQLLLEMKTKMDAIEAENKSLLKDFRAAQRERQNMQRDNEQLRREITHLQRTSDERPMAVKREGQLKRGRTFTGNCFNCNQPGHRAIDCRRPRGKEAQPTSTNAGNGRAVNASDAEVYTCTSKLEEKKGVRCWILAVRTRCYHGQYTETVDRPSNFRKIDGSKQYADHHGWRNGSKLQIRREKAQTNGVVIAASPGIPAGI